MIGVFSIVQFDSKKKNTVKFPFLGYLGYITTKIFDKFSFLSFLADKLETLRLEERLNHITIKNPIFITGLARSGTTIMLEMLSQHPDVATHQYKHFIMPYIPYIIELLLANLNIQSKTTERIHQDGIQIDHNSPEVVEEMFWQQFFKGSHREDFSDYLGKETTHPQFETFYKNHIKKLLLSQDASRYLTKNNYNITRLEYLLKLFPDARIILMIRNPINQIASLIKQTSLFLHIEYNQPLFQDWLKMIGHHEFGNGLTCINTGDSIIISRIRSLWKNKKTYVTGWAYYWRSIYQYVANQLERNEYIKEATYIIDYDKLCDESEQTIDGLIKFLDLSSNRFNKIKKNYCSRLHKPTYYTPNFSPKELSNIKKITESTANRFGLEL
ncbi:MAG: hypothetical protein BAJALOKI1v1_220016 [Promethearchaeota archaeon]|nr:MAG: hypothetical protein BAJALOKI1v1_220016 [Candidatus Lokiarchaeota archaeon]